MRMEARSAELDEAAKQREIQARQVAEEERTMAKKEEAKAAKSAAKQQEENDRLQNELSKLEASAQKAKELANQKDDIYKVKNDNDSDASDDDSDLALAQAKARALQRAKELEKEAISKGTKLKEAMENEIARIEDYDIVVDEGDTAENLEMLEKERLGIESALQQANEDANTKVYQDGDGGDSDDDDDIAKLQSRAAAKERQNCLRSESNESTLEIDVKKDKKEKKDKKDKKKKREKV